MKKSPFSQNLHHNIAPDSAGFTLIELLSVVGLMGVLAVMTGPMLLWANKPLQNGTNQTAGIFKQVRMRAIVTTSTYRVRPYCNDAPNNIQFGGRTSQTAACSDRDPTRIDVQAATTGACTPPATTLTTASAAANGTLSLASVRGFSINDQVQVGTDTTVYQIASVQPLNSRITLSPVLTQAASVGSAVTQVADSNRWRYDPNFPKADTTLPQAKSSIFGGVNQTTDVRLTQQTYTVDNTQTPPVRVANTLNWTNPPDWTMCYDPRGIANLFVNNAATPDQLVLSLRLFQRDTSTPVTNGTISTVSISPGGEVSISPDVIQE
jgi:prepilin-type N-terminal cleavage/methylation domain-containing protein